MNRPPTAWRTCAAEHPRYGAVQARDRGRRAAVWLTRTHRCSPTTKKVCRRKQSRMHLDNFVLPLTMGVCWMLQLHRGLPLEGTGWKLWVPAVHCWQSRSDFLLTCAGRGARRRRPRGLHHGTLGFWGATTVRIDSRRLASRLGCPPHMIRIGLASRCGGVLSRSSGRLRPFAAAAFFAWSRCRHV